MSFTLHPNLEKKIFITDLSLCRVLMENEAHYPWLMLVPRKNGIQRLIDLSIDDQMQVTRELHQVQTVVWDLFKPTQLNVAAIGNKTAQLHIHVIARFDKDPAWPGTVWDHPTREKLSSAVLEQRIQLLKDQLK